LHEIDDEHDEEIAMKDDDDKGKIEKAITACLEEFERKENSLLPLLMVQITCFPTFEQIKDAVPGLKQDLTKSSIAKILHHFLESQEIPTKRVELIFKLKRVRQREKEMWIEIDGVIVKLSTNKERMRVLTQMNLLARQQYKEKQENFKYCGGLAFKRSKTFKNTCY